MRAKKFSYKFKKSYRLIAMMMITASLLGISYGYWSDKNTIKAEIRTPEIVLNYVDIQTQEEIEVNRDDGEESISALNKKHGEDKRTFNIKVEAIEGSDSHIPIEYVGYEIYFIKDPHLFNNEEVLLESRNKSKHKEILSKEIDVAVVLKNEDTNKKKYEFEIKILAYQLDKLLRDQGRNCTMGELKIKLNFKQMDIDGWKYSVEKAYAVRFIEPQPKAADSISAIIQSTDTAGEIGNSQKGDNTEEDNSLGTEDSSSGTEDSSLGTEDSSSGTEDSSSGTEDSSSVTEGSSSVTEGSSSVTEDSSLGTEGSSSGTEDSDLGTEDSSTEIGENGSGAVDSGLGSEDNGSDVGGSSET